MVIDDIRDLLAAPNPSEPQSFLERVDATLTEGYAHALQLEAERWRIEQRIAEIIAQLSADTQAHRTTELADLARRRESADERLALLRTLLGLLKERRTALREAA